MGFETFIINCPPTAEIEHSRPTAGYRPPRGSFVHYNFLKLHDIRNKMTKVSPLYVRALKSNVNVNYTSQNYIFRLR